MADQLLYLPLAALAPDLNQPRRELENDSASITEAHTLQGLANSILEVGILQPIRVRAVVDASGAPSYTIVSGQRRFEAAKMVGLETLPCIVIDAPADASQTLVSQVSENLQRKAMTASELALAVQTLVQSGATQDVVAHKLGIQASQVTLLLNLLVLQGPVKEAFERGRIESPRAAYDLNKLPAQLQEQLIGEAEQKNRIVTQRDVREVKLLHAKKLSLVRHRYEAPAVTLEQYLAFDKCIDDKRKASTDKRKDTYDPSADRDAVFGTYWRQLDALQTQGMQGPSSADTVDALRVRVPGFTLTREQVERLYLLLGEAVMLNDGKGRVPDADMGRDLAWMLTHF